MSGSPSAGIAVRKDYQESWAEFKSITKKIVDIYQNNNILLPVDTILTGQHWVIIYPENSDATEEEEYEFL
jgi:hypothetical protein